MTIEELADDESALDLAATDFGHLVRRRPRGVLRPATAEDVAALVRACAAERVGVAARGSGHSCYGQAQVEDGIVIDMSTLAAIHDVDGDRVTVEAGATWGAVLDRTLPLGLTPPVFTDYVGTTVGGTLSVGGIGGTSYRPGMQVDNVLELEVVTGDGALRTCSPTRDPKLFDAVRAGLGQFGVIIRATLRLMPAPTRVRRYSLVYDSIPAATAAQLELIHSGRFDFVQGQLRAGDNGWRYLLEVTTHYSPPATVDDATILAGLTDQREYAEIEDLSYVDFQKRLFGGEELLRSTGHWFWPHPCWNGFFPVSGTNDFLTHLTETLTADYLGAAGLALFYPVFTDPLTAPLFRVPDGDIVFLVGVLPFPPDEPDLVAERITMNGALYDKARALGGLIYPIGAIPFAHADWVHHFGSAWPEFIAAKARYDPLRLLAPGQRIFSSHGVVA
jgi:FAD/FMN-containing dehydrogenase